MKKIPLGTMIIISALLLSGCGKNTPEDTAEEFANMLSNTNLKQAKALTTENVTKRLLFLNKLCNRDETRKLTDASIAALSTMEKKIRSKEHEKDLSTALEKFKNESNAIKIAFEKEIKLQYASVNDIPKEKYEKLFNDMAKRFSKASLPLIEKEFNLFNIKTEYPKDVKKVISLFMLSSRGKTRVTFRNRFQLKKLAEKVIKEKALGISSVCVSKYTDFGNIDEINIIETKEKAPDKVTVRMELIKKNGGSTKVSMPIEKIKDKWKVSDLDLKNY